MSETPNNIDALISPSVADSIPEPDPNAQISSAVTMASNQSLDSSVDSTISNSDVDAMAENVVDSHQMVQPTNVNSSKNIDWQKLAHKLREHNRKLLKKVFHLEQEVADTNCQIKQKIDQAQSKELLIEQQAKEIKNCQEKIAYLGQELEAAEQDRHNQQILLNSLTSKLELSQQQTAKLERECALLQEKYNQQSYELLTQEKQTKELHSRLNRQQRYTLQYKAALDRYLNNIEASALNLDLEVEENEAQIKSQPIQPWSSVSRQQSAEKAAVPKLELPQPVSPLINNSHHTEGQSKSPRGGTSLTKWPAPEIANTRKEKKPQSLAAVELPRFPRQRPS